MPPARLSPDDLHALTGGVQDLVGDIRRLADKQTDSAAELKIVGARLEAVTTRLEAMTSAIQRLEAQQQSGHFQRVLGTFERAPWQTGALLASILLVLVLILGHVDIAALAAAYSRPKAP